MRAHVLHQICGLVHRQRSAQLAPPHVRLQQTRTCWKYLTATRISTRLPASVKSSTGSEIVDFFKSSSPPWRAQTSSFDRVHCGEGSSLWSKRQNCSARSALSFPFFCTDSGVVRCRGRITAESFHTSVPTRTEQVMYISSVIMARTLCTPVEKRVSVSGVETFWLLQSLYLDRRSNRNAHCIVWSVQCVATTWDQLATFMGPQYREANTARSLCKNLGLALKS